MQASSHQLRRSQSNIVLITIAKIAFLQASSFFQACINCAKSAGKYKERVQNQFQIGVCRWVRVLKFQLESISGKSFVIHHSTMMVHIILLICGTYRVYMCVCVRVCIRTVPYKSHEIHIDGIGIEYDFELTIKYRYSVVIIDRRCESVLREMERNHKGTRCPL